MINFTVDRVPRVNVVKACGDGMRAGRLREIITNVLTTLLTRSELKDFVEALLLGDSGMRAVRSEPLSAALTK